MGCTSLALYFWICSFMKFSKRCDILGAWGTYSKYFLVCVLETLCVSHIEMDFSKRYHTLNHEMNFILSLIYNFVNDAESMYFRNLSLELWTQWIQNHIVQILAFFFIIFIHYHSVIIYMNTFWKWSTLQCNRMSLMESISR